MSRHASAEELASLDLGGLKRRKAERIRVHVAGCVQCTALSRQVAAVPGVLASVSYPPMPAALSVRIETVLAAESSQRLASAPASEAGRRDLPERSRHARRAGGRRHLPGMSVRASRLVATAAAVVVVGAGGFEIASHAGSNTPGMAASSSGSVSAPSAREMSLGPSVHYGQAASNKTVRTFTSDTNFASGTLATQALAAVRAARLSGALGTRATTAPGATAHASATKGSPAAGANSAGQSQLAGCLDRIAGNRTLLLVEQAKYNGTLATILVTAQTATSGAEVWVVGPGCSASNPHVLNHLVLGRT
jgi:hypothetical protein